MDDLVSRLVAAFFAVFVSAAAAADSPDGFRGIKWGSAPSALGPDRVPVSSERRFVFPDEECFNRTNESLVLVSQPLRFVDWCYYKGRLWQVTVIAKTAASRPFIHDSLVQAYGEPVLTGGALVGWGDSRQRGGSTVSLSDIGPGGSTMLLLMSNNERARKEADAKKAARKQF